MRISRSDLVRAAAYGLIDGRQVDRLWRFLGAIDRSAEHAAARLPLGRVLRALGALAGIGAVAAAWVFVRVHLR